MKRKYYKSFKTEVESDAFESLETFQTFEVKLHSFIQQTDKISKTKPNVSFAENNQINNLDFQAMVLNKIVNKSIKQRVLKPKHIEVCQEFGIDYYNLMKIENLEDKQTYVIQCASQTIQKSLDQLLQKYKSDKQENQVEKVSEELDLYSWLKVKSQFKKLKKILQYALVELVGDSSNQDKIKLFFAYVNQNIKKRHKTTESCNFSTAFTSRVKTQNPIEEKLFLNPPKYQFSPPDMFIEWNKAIELGYINQKKNIDRIGYENMKKQNQKGVNYSKREKLLEQCQEGNYITEEELKYLASTSYLINKCVDKEFIQRAINFLDQQVVHQIEMNIAEQVLNNFYFLRKNLIKQRNLWLAKINEQKRINIKIKSKLNAKKNYFLQNSGEIRNIKKKIINQLKDVAKKKQLKVQIEKKKEKYLRAQKKKGNPLANIYVQKFKEIVLSVISKIREKKITDKERQKEFLERNSANPPPKPIFQAGDKIYDINKSKRAFHPPSKIMTNLSEVKFLQANPEVKQNIAKKFKLGIRNYTVTQDQFRDFYSGGPFLPRQYKSPELQQLNKSHDYDIEYPQKNNWITAQIEIQAANKIKTAIKRYLQKKALDKLIVKKEVIKNRDIEIKIKKCMQAKRFFEELHKELSKRQTERLKDISIHQPPKLPLDKIDKKITSSPILSNQKSSNSVAVTSRNLRNSKQHQSQRISITKRSNQNYEKDDQTNLDTARRAQLEIEEIARKKKLMKFSKQKEMSEVKMKNRKLIVAAKMKNLQIALTAGFIYNQRDTALCDRFGNTPLYYCAKNGDEQFCRFLLNLGASVNQQCENLNTPLHMAFLSESKQIIIDFINKGGNLNSLNADKLTPLAFGSKDLLQQLNFTHLVVTTKNDTLQNDNNDVFKEHKVKIIERDFGDTLVYDRYKHKTIF